jgi:hypothetical protein
VSFNWSTWSSPVALWWGFLLLVRHRLHDYLTAPALARRRPALLPAPASRSTKLVR